jgi:ParB/RepB/Spo0J family partition protein
MNALKKMLAKSATKASASNMKNRATPETTPDQSTDTLMKVPVSEIHVGSRMRVGEVSESLVDSIRQNGLLQPIIVSKDGSGRVSLVAGMHRLLAIKKLGWKEVSVCVTDRDPRIVEIDENLVRKELTVLEKAEQIVLKKTLYEGKGFAVETAKLMNATPRLVFMYVQIGSASEKVRAKFRTDGIDDDLRKMLDALRVKNNKPGAVGEIKARYLVMVDCTDEDHQKRVYEALTAKGETCRVSSI